VLSVGPSRDAIRAGLGAARAGQTADRSSLATIRIISSPPDDGLAADKFRRPRLVVLRIDFLRN
jgi:hypothetical protein